jgi:hypothetical protein
MGAMHKEYMASRLGNECDPLTLEVIQTICPEAVEVVSCCILKSGESLGAAERLSEMGLMWEAKDAQGKLYSGECDISAKGCTGFGTSNQLSRFWLNDLLTSEELTTPVGKALTAVAGTAGKGCEVSKPFSPGLLNNGSNAKIFGRPLMTWLGNADNTKRVLNKGFGINDTTKQKVLVLSMRGAGEHGEDLHIAVDSSKLIQAAIAEAIRTTTKGEAYVSIMPADQAIDFSRAVSLKRKGGDAGEEGANQLQFVLRTKGLLEMALENNSKLGARVSYENPTLTSQAIVNLTGKEITEDEGPSNTKKKIWKQLTQLANWIEIDKNNSEKTKLRA